VVWTALRICTSVEFDIRRVYVAHSLYISLLQPKVAQHNDHGSITSVMVVPNLVYEPHDMGIGLLFPADTGIFCKRPCLTNQISEHAGSSLLSTTGHNNAHNRR